MDDLMVRRIEGWVNQGNFAEYICGTEPRDTMAATSLGERGIVVRRNPQLWANVASFGNGNVIVGSFEWLGKTQRVSLDARRDFGIWLEGNDLERAVRGILQT
jgi:hypothetical protein